MENLEYTLKNIDEIFKKLESDIMTLRTLRVPRERIKIAVPLFYYNVLLHYFEKIAPTGNHSLKTIFGCDVVTGYNKQICVFDEKADPRFSIYLEPIEIKM
ncbi:hypothetical protein [Epilithonimonas xixisoli]|uniref:Uncharacterized protein n=1 Tax=Epilithonimonas xixisoli TaxID=1476462 RepID=A0A4R8IH71_9FLAO|nr:hypothetical protein [Epilithonimonas xixisoli]TDX86195.1 hypothetical protein B0I22_0305 [Epilithonimonas xixisoli]